MNNFKMTIMRFYFIAALVAVLNPFAFSQKGSSIKQTETPSYEIPFKLDDHLIMIKGSFDNHSKEYDFIFDTGTSGLVLLDSLSKFYHYIEIGKEKQMSPEGKYMGDRSVVQVDNLSFGSLHIKNKASLVDKEGIFSATAKGIIGLSAFDGYVITIDYTNQKLLMRKGNLEKGKNVLKLGSNDILEADIILNNKTIPTHFDCGSPFFISIPNSIKEKYNLTFKTKPTLIAKARTTGGDMDIFASQFDGNIKIGSIVLNDPKVELVTANFPAINIGYQFFIQYRMSIDFKNKLMKIEPK
jgi:hypothetical protein